ncbi:MAG: hypothetical protein IH626_02735 [Rhodospirillales bacterium]|nr:hypothetical protein [Rhodospirillales bacterium]
MPELSFLKILFTTLKDLSFWTGFVTIVAFSMGRFNERVLDDEELDPPLPNRCFTSRFRYASSALIYVLVYLTIYSTFVVGGSIPALQGPLTELFGSLNVSEQIGTPAWAAMILMVIAPTFERVRKVDLRLRRWLMDFANIPFKARQLAEEIVIAVRRKGDDRTLTPLHELPTVRLCDIADAFLQLRNRLCSLGGERAKSAYREFFNVTYGGIARAVDQRYQTVKKEMEAEKAGPAAKSAEDGLSFRRQLADLVRRNARLTACALLQVEAEEHSARETMRSRCDLPDLAPGLFRFGGSQTVLGVLLVFATCVVVGPTVQFAVGTAEVTPGDIWASLQKWAYWGAVGALAYLLPLVLAASVQLWLLDKEDEAGEHHNWTFKTMVMLTTLAGCFLLAAIPLFIGAMIKARISGGVHSPLIVAFALVPATVAVLFIPISRRRINRPHGINALVDFASFGIAAGIVTYVTGSLVKVAELATSNVRDMGPLFEVMTRGMPAVSMVSLFVGGGFGALQCGASRQLVEAARARRGQQGFAIAEARPVP